MVGWGITRMSKMKNLIGFKDSGGYLVQSRKSTLPGQYSSKYTDDIIHFAHKGRSTLGGGLTACFSKKESAIAFAKTQERSRVIGVKTGKVYFTRDTAFQITEIHTEDYQI
jgi:hypothetical protein